MIKKKNCMKLKKKNHKIVLSLAKSNLSYNYGKQISYS